MLSLIEDIAPLLGESYASDAVGRFLAAQPPHIAQKPGDGAQYIVCKVGGFDLLFEDPEAVAGRRQHRVLQAIFAFNDGAEGHRRFAGRLPFDFSFDDPRGAWIARRPPTQTWKIGEGRVAVDSSFPSSDRWDWEGFRLSVQYYDEEDRIHHVQLGLHEDAKASVWTSPDTWQQLALVPARLLDAIKLYRKEHGVGMAEAKAVIERYRREQAKDLPF